MRTSPATQIGRPAKRRGGYLRKNVLYLLSMAVFLAAGIFVGSTYLEQEARMASLQREMTTLEQRLAKAQAANQAYKKEIELLQTDEYVEMVARRELGLVKPGEIPYMTGLKRR